MTARILSKGNVGGDFLIHEESGQVCRESKTVTNSTGALLTLPAGYPMDDNVPVVQGGEAGCDGLLLETQIFEIGEVRKVAVLARGPAVINKNALPLVDRSDDTFTLATLVTALTALGIICRAEATIQGEQTT